MSQKFIGLDDAAEKLGVSKERLNELREAGDLRAYRDGASWKFRTEEIEKCVAEGLPGADAGDDPLDLDDLELDLGGSPEAEASQPNDEVELGVEPLGEGDDAESILLTEGELEGGLPRPPSTIIGRTDASDDNDLDLAPASSAGGGSAPAASGASFEDIEELELDLEAESSRILEGQDVAAAQAAAKAAKEKAEAAAAPSDLSLELDDDAELELEGSAASVVGGSDPAAAGDASATGELPSGSVSGLSGLDAVELGADEDDDVVLGGSDDLSLSGSDSGINLVPSDSGIALDEVPLDLGGSAIGSALDLAALSAASGMGADDKDEGGLASGEDFLLTPAGGEEGDEEDSSQIVALDEIAEEEEDVVTFSPDESEDEEDAFAAAEGSLGGEFGAGGGGLGVAGTASAAAPAATAVAETTFPVWIMGLLLCSLLTMTLCGMMALDMVQSMWAWNEPYAMNSAVMDGILGLLGG